MPKENYFSGDRCGDFMWGKGLDVPKEKRSRVWHDSETPKFAKGGRVPAEDRYDNYEEMKRIHQREKKENRANRDEERRIHKRAKDEVKKYSIGGYVNNLANSAQNGIENMSNQLFNDVYAKGGKVKRYDIGGIVDGAVNALGGPSNALWLASTFLKEGGSVKKKGMFNNPKIHKGGLHESLGIPEGKKIGMRKIEKATHSRNPLERKQAVLAENMMGKNKKK